MNKTVLKTTKIILIVLIVIALVFSLVVSQDEHHLEICNDEHCIYCIIIHIAQNIVNLASVLFIMIVIGALIFYYLSRVHIVQFVFNKSSLVSQKVQQNE